MSNPRNTLNPIPIFDKNHPFHAELTAIKANRVVIVSAFASKTVDIVRAILRNDNNLTLVVGTINSFTDPEFIRECVDIANHYQQRMTFYVDFRGDDSIHWKLYLLGPSKVIIGSSNLTRTGLSMHRDTAVLIKDTPLFTMYLQRVKDLCQITGVISNKHPRFQTMLNDYTRRHRKAAAQHLTRTDTSADQTSVQIPALTTWFEQDHAQVLPIYIWDRDVTTEERRRFETKVKPIAIHTDAIELIGCYSGTIDDQFYHSGDTILMVKNNGAYAEFCKADMVVYIDGQWWLCGFLNTSFQIPFALTSAVRRAVKDHISSWMRSRKRYLTTTDLRQLAADVSAYQ